MPPTRAFSVGAAVGNDVDRAKAIIDMAVPATIRLYYVVRSLPDTRPAKVRERDARANCVVLWVRDGCVHKTPTFTAYENVRLPDFDDGGEYDAE
jgi:hypothetical protein